MTSTLQMTTPQTGRIVDADLKGIVVNIPAGEYDIIAPIVDLTDTTVITGLLIAADDGAFWAGLAEVAPDTGIVNIPVLLTCGHTVSIHAMSSTWDFPQDGSWCPTCGNHVPLDVDALPGF